MERQSSKIAINSQMGPKDMGKDSVNSLNRCNQKKRGCLEDKKKRMSRRQERDDVQKRENEGT